MEKSFDGHWYPLYHEKFDRSISGWSAEKVGAYILLLNHQWQNNGIPNDKEELIFIARCSKNTLDKVLVKFKTEVNGRLFNPRMETIREEQRKKHEKLSNAGRAGGIASSLAKASVKQRSSNAKKPAKAMVKQIEIDINIIKERMGIFNFSLPIYDNLVLFFTNRIKKKKLSEEQLNLYFEDITKYIKTYGEQAVLNSIKNSVKVGYPDIYEPKSFLKPVEQVSTVKAQPILTDEEMNRIAAENIAKAQR